MVISLSLFLGLIHLNVNVRAQTSDQKPYGTINDEGEFKWAYDQVRYDQFTDGVPANTTFQRIAIFVGDVAETWDMGNTAMPFRYVAHIANDSNNELAGRIFQWIDFFDENGEDWHIHLHQDGYHLDDGINIPHFSGHHDLEYILANPDENLTQGVIDFEINPPQVVTIANDSKELTWSLIEHRVSYLPDLDGKPQFHQNHTAKIKTTWHFSVNDTSALLKQDLMVYDVNITDPVKIVMNDVENSTFVNYWHIGVFTTPDQSGQPNIRPDAYEIDGVIYDSPATIESGHDVKIMWEGIELSQMDLGTRFTVNALETNYITTEVSVIDELADPEEVGLTLGLTQKFPELNYTSFNNFTMDPEIIVPLYKASPSGGIPWNPLSLILVISTVIAIGTIKINHKCSRD